MDIAVRDAVERCKWRKLARCEVCSKLIEVIGRFEDKDNGMTEHMFETGHSSFACLALNSIPISEEDLALLQDHARRLRAAFGLIPDDFSIETDQD